MHRCLRPAGLRRSTSRTGSCLDNAVAEGWFASLKVELVDRSHYRTRDEARTAIFAWIAWYDRRRLHSTCGYLPPIEWEQHHATSARYHQPRPHNPGVHLPGGSPYAWEHRGVVYHITIHGHVNEPRVALMMAAFIKRVTSR